MGGTMPEYRNNTLNHARTMKKTYQVFDEAGYVGTYTDGEIRRCKWNHDPKVRIVPNQVEPVALGDGWEGVEGNLFSAIAVTGCAILGFFGCIVGLWLSV